MNSVDVNLAHVRHIMDEYAQDKVLYTSPPVLIAVSKQQPDDRIDAALAAGQRVFGENRVQDAQARWEGRRERYPDLRLHMIGPLQSNKANDAVALFDMIHTLDRISLADALRAAMDRHKRNLPCLIQVNTGDEDQKSGIAADQIGPLLNHARSIGLNVTGLMCIPPVQDPPGLHFALLKKLAREHDLPELSMGMSGDYETALALGATYIRVGSGIFGNRAA